MRRLIDTNILLYAVNRDCPEHARARAFLEQEIDSGAPWCLSWGVIYEFLRVSTHPRVFPHPMKAADALAFVAALLSTPSLTMLTGTERHLELLLKTTGEMSHAAGNIFHDVKTAVLLREHGVGEIVTADTDFHQFAFLRVTNPIL